MGNANEQTLQQIGEKANKDSPSSFINSSVINLTNATIISENKSDPENDYKKGKQLGQGTHGTVFEAKNRITDIVRAMKIVEKKTKHSKEEEEKILNEENILKTIDHPNNCHVLALCLSDSRNTIAHV